MYKLLIIYTVISCLYVNTHQRALLECSTDDYMYIATWNGNKIVELRKSMVYISITNTRLWKPKESVLYNPYKLQDGNYSVVFDNIPQATIDFTQQLRAIELCKSEGLTHNYTIIIAIIGVIAIIPFVVLLSIIVKNVKPRKAKAKKNRTEPTSSDSEASVA